MSTPDAAHLTDDVALAYVFGALEDRARVDVATHVGRCAVCAATVARFDREQAVLFEQLRAAADARPPGRATEWSAVRDRIVEPRRGFAWTWRWAAGTIGGLSAPFLFAVGVASAAGVSYAALPPVRHAVDRVLGIAAATPTPAPAPTAEPTAVRVAPATATPPLLPTPTPVLDVGAPPEADKDRADETAPDPGLPAGTRTALPLIPSSPTAPAAPTWVATTASDAAAGGLGAPPAAATSVPTAPAANATAAGGPEAPGGPTPPVRPTPDRDGRGGRGGPGGGRPPVPPPPGGQPGPGPGPGPGPRPTESGAPPPGAPPGSTPSASRTPGRRERGPGHGGHDRPPDGPRGERTPEPGRP